MLDEMLERAERRYETVVSRTEGGDGSGKRSMISR